MLCFQLLPTLQATFQTKNSVRSTPASLSLILKPPQIITYMAVEKGIENKGEQK